MKNQKLILLFILTFTIISEAKLRSDNKYKRFPHGDWSNYRISSNYKLDSNQPLSIIFNNLAGMLEKSQIQNINFQNAQIQTANSMNFKIQFSYEQDSILKHGTATAYAQTETNTFNIISLNLEKREVNKSAITGGWDNYKIENGYQSNPQSSLYQVQQEISKVLIEKKIEFIRFDKVISQSGINFQVIFTCKQNGKEKQGQCDVYFRPWENKTEVSNLQIDFKDEEVKDIKVEELIDSPSEESGSIAGGYSKYDYEADFQTNSSNPLHYVINELKSKLIIKDLEFVKIVNVDRQIINGTNYHIKFIYKNSSGKENSGDCIIHVPFTIKSQVIKLNLNEQNSQISRIDWQDVQINENTTHTNNSILYQAEKIIIGSVQSRGFTFEKIESIQQQILYGINYKINFSYLQSDQLKTGQAIVNVPSNEKSMIIKKIIFDKSSIQKQQLLP